jgi:autophagy-related protein 27
MGLPRAPPRRPHTLAQLLASLATLAALLPAPASAAVGFRCEQVVDGGVRWDLSPLKGPHAVAHDFPEEPKMARWNFTLDLCSALKLDSAVDKKRQCPTNTRGT